MLRDIPIVKVVDPKIKKDVKNECEVEKGEIRAVCFGTHFVLNCPVDTENPKRLDKHIQKNKKSEVGEEFPLHVRGKCSLLSNQITKRMAIYYIRPRENCR